MGFTPAELAEMARADAEIEASSRLTREDLKRSRELDRVAVLDALSQERQKVAEYQRAYYEANREKVAERQRAYREANREKVAERQRAIAAARKAHGWTQAELAGMLGVSRITLSQWELGYVKANWAALAAVLPELKEAEA